MPSASSSGPTCGCRCSGGRVGRCAGRRRCWPARRAGCLAVAGGLVGLLASAAARRRGDARRCAGRSSRWRCVGGRAGAPRRAPVGREPGPIASWRDGAAVGQRTSPPTRARWPDGSPSSVVLRRLGSSRSPAAGRRHDLRRPVLVLADAGWRGVPLGSDRAAAPAGCAPADGRDLAAVAPAARRPEVVGRPAPGGGRRRGPRRRCATRWRTVPPASGRWCRRWSTATTPALDPGLADDFRTTGLTHLLAVSGTNLTLVVGFLLVLGPLVRGARALARTSSAAAGHRRLRAARPHRAERAAGRRDGHGRAGRRSAPTAGTGASRRSASRSSCCCCSTRDWPSRRGFALSVLATAGILLLAPGWRDALGPLAAPLAGRGDRRAGGRPARLHAGGRRDLRAGQPGRGRRQPAGRAGGRPGDRARAGGRAGRRWSGRRSAGCSGTLAGVVRGLDRRRSPSTAPRCPAAAVGWGDRRAGAGAADAARPSRWSRCRPGCCGAGRRRLARAAACSSSPCWSGLPTPGWPPTGWVLVACDVGQGDALVLNAGPGSAVVVDAGPDPRRWTAASTGSASSAVPLLVLTHFHADHVDGLAGVLDGRTVGEVEITRLPDPPGGVARSTPRPPSRSRGRRGDVRRDAARSATSRCRCSGRRRTRRRAVLATAARPTTRAWCCWSRCAGVRMLLTRRRRARGPGRPGAALPGLRVDVLKVPHHGSRHQDLRVARLPGRRRGSWCRWVPTTTTATRPRAALDPLGATPVPRSMRTDLDGDAGGRRSRDGELRASRPWPDRRRPASSAGCDRLCRTMAGSAVTPADVARPGHAGDRQGGVPRRAHCRRRPRRGAPRTTPRPSSPRRGARPRRWRRSASWPRRRCSRLRCVVVRGAGGPARRVGRRSARLRRARRWRTSRWCWCTAAGRRASGVLDQAAQAAGGDRGRSRPSCEPRSSPGSWPPRSGATARRSTRRPRRSWSRRSARTCARWRPRPTSSPATSPASR